MLRRYAFFISMADYLFIYFPQPAVKNGVLNSSHHIREASREDTTLKLPRAIMIHYLYHPCPFFFLPMIN